MVEAAASKGLGFWPKVAIWAAVIAVGALYLGSVDHKLAKDERRGPPPQVGEPQQAPAAALVGSSPEQPPSIAAPPAEPRQAVDAPSPGLPEPPPAEAAQLAGEAAPPPAAGDAEPPPVGPEAIESEAGTVAMPEPPVAEPSPEAPKEVSPAEAEAFAKAVLSEPEPQPDPSVAAETEPEPAVSAEPAPGAVQDDAEAQRARVLAEYEAMRRRAEEEMRRRWQGPGLPATPYGAPGVPGYYPQPYPVPPPYWRQR